MNSEKRREYIMNALKQTDRPISASKLAKELSVSRQIIVGDVALLRASGEKVLATPRGDKEAIRLANTTREDHRTIMDAMIKLYASYKETVEKQSMGFKMSSWDQKLLKYGEMFEREMMDLSVNIELVDALDLGWRILSECFEKGEVGIPSKYTDKYWPKA